MSFTEIETNNIDLITINRVPYLSGRREFCYSSINSVPAGAAWQATSGSVPYNDAAAGYSGYQVANGTAISYNVTTHQWTITRAGVYQIQASQTIDISNSIGVILSNGRLQVSDSTSSQVGGDSGRYESTAGMAAIGMLSYDISLDVVAALTPGTYTIDAVPEIGSPGLLIGKGSCMFQLLL